MHQPHKHFWKFLQASARIHHSQRLQRLPVQSDLRFVHCMDKIMSRWCTTLKMVETNWSTCCPYGSCFCRVCKINRKDTSFCMLVQHYDIRIPCTTPVQSPLTHITRLHSSPLCLFGFDTIYWLYDYGQCLGTAGLPSDALAYLSAAA